eukprot:gene5320-6625_t
MTQTLRSNSYVDIHLDSIQEEPYSVQPPLTSRSNSNVPRRGKRIGNYIVGKTIGSGTSSKVKIGTNVVTGKKVAIKITKPKRIKERKEIEREISILKLLKHDNIIQLYDAIYEDDRGRICLILELVSGGELFDYIVARGRLSEKEARKFFRQIISGLWYCHSNMVCHRDLKLENLLVDEDGNIKISDFGYSNIVKPGNLMSTFCGSPVYAPPEILLEKKYVGTEVDIWSIGIILYAMVTGQLPWSLTDGVQVEGLDRLLKGEFKYPPNVILSNDVKDLINRMIIANPNDRAKLSEIKSHPWINKGYEFEPDEEYNRKNLQNGASEDFNNSIVLENNSNSNSDKNKPSLYCSSPNIYVPKSIATHPTSFSTSNLEIDQKRGFSSPSSASTTPPLSPISSSSSGQKSPPTPSTPTFKTSLFHGLFKKKLFLSKDENVNNNSGTANSGNINNCAGSPNLTSATAGSSPSSPALSPTSGSPAAHPTTTRRRFSLEDIVKVIRGKSKNRNEKLRSIKGPFTSGTTTMMPPIEVVRQMEEILNSLAITYQQNAFLFECKYVGTEIIIFEIEICRVSGMEMYGIKFRRLCGDVWGYSTICKQIVESLQL